jgi:hypothetical protein
LVFLFCFVCLFGLFVCLFGSTWTASYDN